MIAFGPFSKNSYADQWTVGSDAVFERVGCDPFLLLSVHQHASHIGSYIKAKKWSRWGKGLPSRRDGMDIGIKQAWGTGKGATASASHHSMAVGRLSHFLVLHFCHL